MTYFVYCINAFAAYHGLTSKQAFAYLHRFKGLDFLDECYEAETMAVRRTRIAGEGEPTLTAYHFDERMLLNAALNVKVFDAPCLANSHPPMNEQAVYLTSSLVEQLALLAMRDYGLTMNDALSLVYNSQWYEKISDTETGLYIQSAAYNYQLLRHEMAFGKVV